MSRRDDHRTPQDTPPPDDARDGTGDGHASQTLRSGFIAVLGRPNVGKSTLVNRLVGRKVSIVSDRPQTTRRRIAGVVTRPGVQAVLLDLPGFQRPFDELTRRMQRTVDETLGEVDAALILLSAKEAMGGGDRYIVAAAAAAGTPAVVALNKCDAVSDERLAASLVAAQSLADDLTVLPVSALRGDNVEELFAVLADRLTFGPQYFPDGTVSDQPLEVLVAELVREQVLRRTREEVPHAIAVQVEEIVEREDRPLVEIAAIVVVETDSQKAIVIGKGGAMIKRIGSSARQEIEAVVGAKVFLSLRVKVRRKWRRDQSSVERFL
jgi:GTP-binding protein Era